MLLGFWYLEFCSLYGGLKGQTLSSFYSLRLNFFLFLFIVFKAIKNLKNHDQTKPKSLVVQFQFWIIFNQCISVKLDTVIAKYLNLKWCVNKNFVYWLQAQEKWAYFLLKMDEKFYQFSAFWNVVSGNFFPYKTQVMTIELNSQSFLNQNP